MPTERNAKILRDLATLTDHVARLDAVDVPVAHVIAVAELPTIRLDLNHFRAYFAGHEVVVRRRAEGGDSDDYRIEVDGVTYTAVDWCPERAKPVTETIRLPIGDAVAAK